MIGKSALCSLVLGAAVLPALPARACLNDRSTITAENDFKSSYLKKKETPEPQSISMGGWIAIGAGIAFTGLAGVVTLRGKRPR
jgi:hypothetical protein